MSRYEMAFRTVDGTAAVANTELRSTSTDRPRLMEMGLWNVTAVAGVVGLGVPAAIGITPSGTAVKVLSEEPVDPLGTTIYATAWTTAPTAPTAFYRRFEHMAQVGYAVLLAFPRGITIALNSSLVYWNIATAPLFDAYTVVDE